MVNARMTPALDQQRRRRHARINPFMMPIGKIGLQLG